MKVKYSIFLLYRNLKSGAFIQQYASPTTSVTCQTMPEYSATENNDITITLSKTQVKQVMRGATDDDALAKLLGGSAPSSSLPIGSAWMTIAFHARCCAG